MNLRLQQKTERRNRILDAAREIIASTGFETLTMRELARAARVTVPTIYNLIGSKDELLRAAVEQQTEGFIAGIDSSPRQTPASRILSVVNVCVDELLRLPDYYQSLLRLLLTSQTGDSLRNSVTDSLSQQFERALLDMAEAGELADWADPRALADRLGSHMRITAIEWAAGELDAHGLRSDALYGTSLMLLGVSEGESALELEACARQSQRCSEPQALAPARSKPANEAS